VPGPPLDLAGLQVAGQGREAEAVRTHVNHTHGPIPRPRHVHQELVSLPHLALGTAGLPKPCDLPRRHMVRIGREQRHQLLRCHRGIGDRARIQTVKQRTRADGGRLHVLPRALGRQGRRQVFGQRSRHFRAVDGEDPPHVVPCRPGHPERPAGASEHAAAERDLGRHQVVLPRSWCRSTHRRVAVGRDRPATRTDRNPRLAASRRVPGIGVALPGAVDPRQDRRSGIAGQRRAPRDLRRALAADAVAHRGRSRARRGKERSAAVAPDLLEARQVAGPGYAFPVAM
jgi:hypothetical protein